MRLVSDKCPNCGARLKVSDDSASVSCEYCGTTSRLQLRTRILEAARPPNAPAPPHQPAMPVATQVHSRGWLALVFVIPVLLGVVGSIGFFVQSGMIGGGGMRLWHHVGPIVVADVNGDGIPDPIGRVHYPMHNSDTHLTALSGTDGSTLWESERLGEFGDVAADAVIGAGGAVVVSKDGGQLHGFDLKTGKLAWSAQLPEKANLFCRGADPGQFLVQTADEAWVQVSGSDGSVGASTAPNPCAPISRRHVYEAGPDTLVLRRSDSLPRFDEMRVDRAHQRLDSSHAVAFGSRAKGTRVPMVGVYDVASQDLAWSAEVPASNPLQADTGAPYGVIDQEHIAVTYEVKDTWRLTLFRISDGKRLWDVRMNNASWRVTGLALTAHGVYASAAGLYGFDVNTGSPLFEAAVTTNR